MVALVSLFPKSAIHILFFFSFSWSYKEPTSAGWKRLIESLIYGIQFAIRTPIKNRTGLGPARS